jgi:hypothetical protein
MRMGFLSCVAVSLAVSLMDIDSASAVGDLQSYRIGYGLIVGSRISCDEGREIVSVRGYYSVRAIECRGDTYTYLGRRKGDSFKVAVNPMTGRIAEVDRIF